MAKNLKDILKDMLVKLNRGSSYIPYMDSEGHTLSEDDILFMNEEMWQRFNRRDEYAAEPTVGAGYYTVHSSDVSPIFDTDNRNFPTALDTPDGRMYLKVSAFTREILPIHAGCCPSIDIIYTGAPSAGKTVHILQMIDPDFHDMLVRDTSCSFTDDLPYESPSKKRYEMDEEKFKKEHILPAPTRKNESITPYVFHVKYRDGQQMQQTLIRLQDIDGEACLNISWESRILPFKYFFLMVGADDLTAGERREPVRYTQVIDQLIPRLNTMKDFPDYEMVVIISKSDLLDPHDRYLEGAISANSVEIFEKKLHRTIHSDGFDMVSFEKRSECIRNYLMNQCPNFYNSLVNSVPTDNITFCMIASIGEKCGDSNSFKNYRPFCIDEPILSVLAKKGMYPVKESADKSSQLEEVPETPLDRGQAWLRNIIREFFYERYIAWRKRIHVEK